MTFSAPGLASGLTLLVDVVAGAPAGVAVTRQPDSVAVGGRLRVQPVVELRDAADNPTQGSLTVQAELVGGGVPLDVATRAVTGVVARGGAPGELEGLLRPVATPGEDQAERARDLLRALDGRERRP